MWTAIVGAVAGGVGVHYVYTTQKYSAVAPPRRALTSGGEFTRQLGALVQACDVALSGDPRRTALAGSAIAALALFTWVLLVSSYLALLCLIAASSAILVAAHYVRHSIRKRGVLHLLPPELRRRFSVMTLLEWIRDDSLSKKLAPFRPLILGLSDDELALYLDSAPPEIRELLLRKGLGNLLPASTQALLFGENRHCRSLSLAGEEEGVQQPQPLVAERGLPNNVTARATHGRQQLLSDTDIDVPSAIRLPFFEPTIMAAASSRPQQRDIESSPAAAAASSAASASPVDRRIPTRELGQGASSTAPPLPPPPAWQSEVIAAVLRHRVSNKANAALDKLGLSADVLLDASVSGTAVTLLTRLLLRASNTAASRRSHLSAFLAAPTALAWVLLLVRWLADREEHKFTSLRRSRALLAYGRLVGAVGALATSTSTSSAAPAAAAAAACAHPLRPDGGSLPEQRQSVVLPTCEEGEDAASVLSASSATISPLSPCGVHREAGAFGPFTAAVRALDFRLDAATIDWTDPQTLGVWVRQRVQLLLGARQVTAPRAGSSVALAAAALSMVFALMELRRRLKGRNAR